MLIINGWVVRPDTCVLSRGEETRKISPRCMDVLCYLAKNPGEVISAHQLLDKFWLKSSASDHAVHNVLASLRHAFGEDASNPQVIRTYPKRGYALIGKVEEVSDQENLNDRARNAHLFHSVTDAFALMASKRSILIGAVLVLIVASVLTGRSYISSRSLLKENTLHVEFQQTDSDMDVTDYLERGFDHSLVSSLTRISGLKLGFSGKHALFNLNLPDLDKSVARYLLSIKKDPTDSGFVVSVSLTDTDSSELLLLDMLEINSENFISQQDRLLQDLESALRVYLDSDKLQDMSDWGTSNAVAYDNFIKAEFYAAQYNHEDWYLALKHYQKAIDEDPLFVNAYVGLGSSVNLVAVYSGYERNAELKKMVVDYGRQLAMLLPGSPAIQTLKSLALNIDGVSQDQLEENYRQRILAGNAPDYVYAQYALFLIGARLYKEAEQFLDLADASGSFTVSPNDSWNYRTLILTPWEIVPVKKAQLYDRPAHIGILGKLIYSLALIGESDEAEYYLRQQALQDKEGIRNHLSTIIVKAENGELAQDYAISQSLDDSLMTQARGMKKQSTNLLSYENSIDPNLQFNNGIMQFIIGNLDEGARHWRNLKPTDRRSLFTRIHALEVFFDEEVLLSSGYAKLLEELGVGVSWQHSLIDGVEEMRHITGVIPSQQAIDARQSGRLLLTNNHWSESDWKKLKELRHTNTE